MKEQTSLKKHPKMIVVRVIEVRKTLYTFFFFLSFFFFRATPETYGGSQARGLIRAVAAGLQHSGILAASAAYTTAHGNAGSLTH